MARIRYLKPEFFFDDDLAALDFGSRLFFQGLWCYADREGRLEDKPKVLKAQIMPYDSVNPDKILDKLEGKFIVRYESDGRKYIQINNFIKHQKPHHTEKESLIPSFNGVITVKQPSENTLKEKEKEKEKEKGKGKCIEIPGHISSELWSEFLEMRKLIKKPMTDSAQMRAFKKLDRFREAGHDIKKVIEQSIDCNWQDFYEPKNNGTSTETKPDKWNLKDIDYNAGLEGFEKK